MFTFEDPQVKCGGCNSWVDIYELDSEIGICWNCIDELLIGLANEQNKRDAQKMKEGTS